MTDGELFVYSLKYQHILILDQKLFKTMTVVHYDCLCCYFSIGLWFTQSFGPLAFSATNKKVDFLSQKTSERVKWPFSKGS